MKMTTKTTQLLHPSRRVLVAGNALLQKIGHMPMRIFSYKSFILNRVLIFASKAKRIHRWSY